MTHPYKNNAFAVLRADDSGGFSAKQSKLWRHVKNSYWTCWMHFEHNFQHILSMIIGWTLLIFKVRSEIKVAIDKLRNNFMIMIGPTCLVYFE